VNEGDSLKEYGSAGKQTRTPARENHQIRGILVTLDNADWHGMFRPAHIERKGSFRKCCGGPQYRFWRPLTDRLCSLKQQ
jgi:hypothetical protein